MLKPWSGYPVFHDTHFRDSRAGGKDEMRGLPVTEEVEIYGHNNPFWHLANVYLFGFAKHVRQ